MKCIYTTENGNITVDVETGRQKVEEDEFFSLLEGREPRMVDLPDAYHVRDARAQVVRHTYRITEDRYAAIHMADELSAEHDRILAGRGPMSWAES